MSSLGSILDTSLSALLATRAALGTVAHNIANANTPGYSRQEVLLGTNQPARYSYGQLGRGVRIQDIRRLTDRFLLDNHRAQSSRLADYAQVDGTLKEIEAILGSVDSDPLGQAMNDFFNAWSELATPPADSTMKQAVVSTARSLVTQFHALTDSIDDLQESLSLTLQSDLAQFNALLQQLGELNQHILAAEAGSGTANDLRDQRDALIGQIAELAKVSVLEREDGTVDLIMAGRTLVTRNQVQTLRAQRSGSQEQLNVVLRTADSGQLVTLAEGKLAGALAAQNEHVQPLRSRLDELASLIVQKVNELHVQGRSHGQTGQLFFTGDSARDIQVSAVLLEDPERVATSRSGLSGDTDIAREIADLAQAPLAGEGSGSLIDSYRTFLTDLATRRARYEFLIENQQNVVSALQSRLESVRGVSLDEEGANMVQLQNAYEAAAKVVSAVQEMFDTLLDMT
jgi:flagellar hook-associated protein 1 FlgK